MRIILWVIASLYFVNLSTSMDIFIIYLHRYNCLYCVFIYIRTLYSLHNIWYIYNTTHICAKYLDDKRANIFTDMFRFSGIHIIKYVNIRNDFHNKYIKSTNIWRYIPIYVGMYMIPYKYTTLYCAVLSWC